jgi:hypothetical protein
MSLRALQSKFVMLVGKLIEFAYANGMELTFGEALRTPEQQEIYFQKGLSKTKNSKHLFKLAIDFNLFINSEYRTDKPSYQILGDYWKSLDPECVWGGDWGWDANHFQYTK